MNIDGINYIKLEVQDVVSSGQFLSDLGLQLQEETDSMSSWCTLDSSKIIIEKSHRDQIVEICWGTTDSIKSIDLEDPSGIKVSFKPSTKQPVNLTATGTNGWNSINRLNKSVPLHDNVDPIEICHVVLATKDLLESEKFYTNLGFVVSDRLINRGIFLRSSMNSGHHDLFLIQSTENKLHHIAITVKDIYQIFSGGIRMEKQGWQTEIGPGRHPISSSFFWYFKSPLGGMIEYTCNEDFLTEDWVARNLEYSIGMTTEWAIDGGIDPISRRQRK